MWRRAACSWLAAAVLSTLAVPVAIAPAAETEKTDPADGIAGDAAIEAWQAAVAAMPVPGDVRASESWADVVAPVPPPPATEPAVSESSPTVAGPTPRSAAVVGTAGAGRGVTASAVGSQRRPCTVTWDGSAADGQWTTASNWDTGTEPAASDVACVPAGAPVPTLGSSRTLVALVAPGGLNLTGGTLELTDADPAFASSVTGLALAAPARLVARTGLAVDGGTLLGRISGVLVDLAGTIAMGTGTTTIDRAGEAPVAVATSAALTLTSVDTCNGSFGAGLLVDGDLTNTGTLTLRHVGGCQGGVALLDVRGALSNEGTIAASGDGPSTPTEIAAHVTNTGSVTVSNAILHLRTPAKTWSNAGRVQVAAGASVVFAADTTFANVAGGAVENAGSATFAGSVLQGDGTAPGAGQAPEGSGPFNDLSLTGEASITFAGSGTSGYTVPPGAHITVAGGLSAEQRLSVVGFDTCNGAVSASVTTLGAVTSAGTLELRHAGTCGGGAPSLVAPDGSTFTSSGAIALTGDGGPHEISGDVTSTGSTTAAIGTTTISGSFTNRGSFSVASAAAVTTPGTFTNAAGSILVSPDVPAGSFSSTGAFVQGSGVVMPASRPVDVRSSLSFSGAGAGAFHQPPSTELALSGDMAAGQTLVVEGHDSCNGSFPATVRVAGDLTAGGTLELRHSSTCGGGTASLMIAAGATVTNTGTFVASGDGGANAHLVSGAFVNEGTARFVLAASGRTALAAPGDGVPAGVFTNLGEVSVGANHTLAVPAGATFVNGHQSATGPRGVAVNVTNDGVVASAGTVVQGAGTTANHPIDVSGALTYTGGGASSYHQPPSTELALSGDMAAGQTLVVQGHDSCNGSFPATATASSGFTNRGAIVLEQTGGCGGGKPKLAIAAGATLLNEGTVAFTGAAGPHELAGSIDNRGSVTVGAVPVSYATSGTTWTNRGRVDVAAGGTLDLGAGTTFDNAPDGVLANAGAVESRGAFVQSGGLAPGAGQTADGLAGPYNDIRLRSGAVGFTAAGVAGFAVQPSAQVLLAGATHPGQRVKVIGHDSCNGSFPATLTTSGPVTNGGTIELFHSSSCGGGNAGLSVEPGETLRNTGTISVTSDTSAPTPHSISGALDNLGELRTEQGTLTLTGPGSLTNRGAITVGAGTAVVTTNGFLVTNLAGTVAVSGSFTSDTTFVQGGGTTAGADVTIRSGTLSFTGGGHSSFVIPAGHSAALSGDLSEGQRLTVTGFDSCNGNFGATANAAASFTNGGTITLRKEGGCGGGQPRLQLPAGAALTNTGTLAAVTGANVSAALAGSLDNRGLVTVDGGPFDVSGDVVNAGRVRVSPNGRLNGQDLDQQPSGTLEVTVAGTPSSQAFSKFAFTGAASLAGFVEVDVSGNHDVAVGERYPFLTHASAEGVFRRVRGQLSPAKGFGAAYAGTHTDLEVVETDLRVAFTASAVTSTSTAGPGGSLAIDATITNNGPDTAPARWSDSVYLATGPGYDPSARLLGRVERAADVEPGGSYALHLDTFANGVVPGDYFVVVVPDSAGRVSYAAANTQASAPIEVTEPPLLVPGQPRTPTVAAGQDLVYRADVPADEDVKVQLDAPAGGAVEVFAAHGRFPTPADFDRRIAVGPASAAVTLPQSTSGTWYLVLHGNAAAGAPPGTAVTLSASLPGLTIARSNPAQGGNNGPVTVGIEGSGYRADLAVELRRGDASVAGASPVVRTDSTVAFATLDLSGVAPGAYDLVARSGGRTATVVGGFTVVTGTPGRVSVASTAPGSLRFGWPGTVTVTLRNDGTTDVAIPVIRLTATNGNAELAAGGSTDYRESVDLVDPDFSASGALLPRSILPPGQTATVSVKMISRSQIAHDRLRVRTQLVTSNDTTVIDWPSQLEASRPDGMADATWSGIAGRLGASLGATGGAYARSLVALLREARAAGDTFGSEAEALSYAIRRQLATDPAAPVSGVVRVGERRLDAAELTLASPSSVHTVVSWKDGRFAFWDVAPGHYDLTVGGHLPRPAIGVDAVPTATGLDVAVTDGSVVEGTVTAAGVPVIGAVVSVLDASGSVESHPTGADGRYRLGGVAPGEITVSAHAPGYLPSPAAAATAALDAPATVDLAVAEGAAITGAVLDGGGEAPTGDVSVVATLDDGTGPAIAGTVGAGGAYRVGGLLPGTYRVTASAPGVGLATVTGVSVTGTATTGGVDLELADTATVTGTVTDARTGEALDGVTVYSDAPGAPPAVRTGADGTFTLEGIAPGDSSLRVAPSDGVHLPATAELAGVVAGETRTRDVALSPAGSLAVTVADGSGTPIADTLVTVAAPGPAGTTVIQTLTTDDDGAATTEGLLEGEHTVRVAGSDVAATVDITAADPAPVVDLVVPVARLQGTVTSASGEPVAGVEVGISDGARRVVSAETDGSGTYELRVTRAGVYDVVASGHGFGFVVTSGVALTPGTPETLDITAGPASLAVLVTADDIPVERASVVLRSTSPALRDASTDAATDASGLASLTGLPAGAYQLTVSGAGVAAHTATVVVPEGGVSVPVALEPGGTLTGTITGPGAPGSIVRVSSAAGLGAATIAGPDGRYTLANLPAGTYAVGVTSGNPLAAPATATGVVVAANGLTTRNLALGDGGHTFTLQVGDGARGAPVLATVLDGGGLAVLSRVVDGTGPVGPLPAGDHTVVVSGLGTTAVSAAVTLPAADPVAVARPAGQVLVGSAGAPLGAERTAASAPGGTREELAGGPPAVTLSPYDLVLSWMGGDLAVPPQESDSDNVSLLRRYHNAIAAALDPDCPNYAQLRALQDRLRSLFRQKVNSLQSWQMAYDALTQTGTADLLIAANDVIQTVNAVNQIALSLSFPAASLAAQLGDSGGALAAYIATHSLNTESLQTAVSVVGNLVGLFSSTVSATISAPSSALDQAAFLTSTINSVVGTLITLAGPESPVLPVASGLISLLTTLQGAYANFQTALGNANAALNAYELAEFQYRSALVNLSRTLNEFEALAASGDCPPPPPPPYPPPPPPPPTPDTDTDNVMPNDPNDITGPAGFGEGHWLAGRPVLPYLVRFENDAEVASAPAVLVTVTEEVPASIDPSSVRLTGFGFGDIAVEVSPGGPSFERRLDLRSTIGDFVDVSGRFDPTTRTITWTLSTIDPATGDLDTGAEAGFLPVNDDTGRGEGFLSWVGQAAPGLPSGTIVPAKASIVFDRNAAIETPEWTNGIDTAPPTAAVSDLPASSPAGPLAVQWSGNDGVGSGVRGFDVFVSVDGGPLTLWQDDVTTTTATYELEVGKTYGFAAAAVDNLGNQAPAPGAATETTTVTDNGTQPPQPPAPQPQPPAAPQPPAPGYGLVSSDGGVHALGATPSAGSASTLALAQPVVGAARVPGGYHLAARDGGVFSFGAARFSGSMGGSHLNAPIVGIAATPAGDGYWLVASDGGVFSFGAARFFGSMGGSHLNAPIVGIAATPAGDGYWLVASDGGVFTFGAARFFGSTGGMRLNRAVVAMAATPAGDGYWLVASDGGVFTFGAAPFFGSTGGMRLNRPVVGIRPLGAVGYWLFAADGGVFAFGSAPFLGVGRLTSPVVGGF